MTGKRKAGGSSAPRRADPYQQQQQQDERPARRPRLDTYTEDPIGGGDSPLTALSAESPPEPIGTGPVTRRNSGRGTPRPSSGGAGSSVAMGRRGSGRGQQPTPSRMRASAAPSSSERHARTRSDDQGLNLSHPLPQHPPYFGSGSGASTSRRPVTPLAPHELRMPQPPHSRPPSASEAAWQQDEETLDPSLRPVRGGGGRGPQAHPQHQYHAHPQHPPQARHQYSNSEYHDPPQPQPHPHHQPQHRHTYSQPHVQPHYPSSHASYRSSSRHRPSGSDPTGGNSGAAAFLPSAGGEDYDEDADAPGSSVPIEDEYEDPTYPADEEEEEEEAPAAKRRGKGGRGGRGGRGGGASGSGTAGGRKSKATKVAAPRTSRACTECRKQKMRCKGAEDPPCQRCRSQGLTCEFERRSDYILNPDDRRWQRSVDDRLSNLAASVDSIVRCLTQNRFHHVPSGPSDLPHLLNSEVREGEGRWRQTEYQLVKPVGPPPRAGEEGRWQRGGEAPGQGQGPVAGPSRAQEEYHDPAGLEATFEMDHGYGYDTTQSQSQGRSYHQSRHAPSHQPSNRSQPHRQPQSDLRSTAQDHYGPSGAHYEYPDRRANGQADVREAQVVGDPIHQRTYAPQTGATVSDPMLSLTTAAEASLQPPSSSMPNFSTHQPSRTGAGRGDTVVVGNGNGEAGFGDPRRQSLARAREAAAAPVQTVTPRRQPSRAPSLPPHEAEHLAADRIIDAAAAETDRPVDPSNDALSVPLETVIGFMTTDHPIDTYWGERQDRIWASVFEKRGMAFDPTPEGREPLKNACWQWREDDQADRLTRDAVRVIEEWAQLFPSAFLGSWTNARNGRPDLFKCPRPLAEALLCLVAVRHPDERVKDVFVRLYYDLTQQARAIKTKWKAGELPGRNLRDSFDTLVAFILGTLFLAAPSNPDYFLRPSRVYTLLTSVNVLVRSHADVMRGVFSYAGADRDDPTSAMWWRMWLWLSAVMLFVNEEWDVPDDIFEFSHWKSRRDLLNLPEEHREPSDVILLAILEIIAAWHRLKVDWLRRGHEETTMEVAWERNRRCMDSLSRWEMIYRARIDQFKAQWSLSQSAVGLLKTMNLAFIACKTVGQAELVMRINGSNVGCSLPDELYGVFFQAFTDASRLLEQNWALDDMMWLRNAPVILQRTCFLPIVLVLKAIRARDFGIVHFEIDSDRLIRRMAEILNEFANGAGFSDRGHPWTSTDYIHPIFTDTYALHAEHGPHAAPPPPRSTAAARRGRARSGSVVDPPAPTRGADNVAAALAAGLARHQSAIMPSREPIQPTSSSVSMPLIPTSVLSDPDGVGGAGASSSSPFAQFSPPTAGGSRAQPDEVAVDATGQSPAQPSRRRESAASFAEEIFNDDSIFDLPMQRARSLSVEDVEDILSNPDFDGPVEE